MPLSDPKLRSLKPGPKPRKVTDGGGLHVLVTPSGGKLWRLAYRFGGKQKTLALGAYPVVGLSEARQRALDAKRTLEAGKDPAPVKKAARRAAAGSLFATVAEEWLAKQKPGWEVSYYERMKARMEGDLIPALGTQALADIEPVAVLEAVRKIERRGAPEMARRVLQMAGSIFRYGVATSRCKHDPTSALRGALEAAPPVKHRTAMRESELPAFLRRLDAYEGEPVTRFALNFVLMTFVRTNELRFAEWSEFTALDNSAPLWRIPAERMKMKREHLVPLPPQAVALLADLRRLTGGGRYLFPGEGKREVISENTMIFALYRMGYRSRATVHGFRSTASTVLNEHGWNRDWVEMQLAHFDGSVRGIYNAAEYLRGRREMMTWWASFVESKRPYGDLSDLI